MTANLLFLTPADPYTAPERAAVIARLIEVGFIGASMKEENFFKPGADFFRFITFLGCSPVVALGEAGATAEICCIEIAAALPEPLFVAGKNLKNARCPGCGHRTQESRAIGEAWQKDHAHRWRCPACGYDYAAPQLQWRQCAGFGRFFLKILGVFEGEAVASDPLLDELATFSSGEQWRSFYIQW